MSYNNYYNNFPPNVTFQRFPPCHIPPPPLPPPFFMAPVPPNPEISDQQFLRTFESKIPSENTLRPKPVSINTVKENLRNLVCTLNKLKEEVRTLSSEAQNLSDEEWKLTLEEINKKKSIIDKTMMQINDTYLNTLKKSLAKRASKRLRLKRLRSERKKEKEDRLKQMEERSRKIDENLQKIKDDIKKAEQEEEAKIRADVVLRDTLRKKHDAKKYLAKLDALMRLRKARQNTAKGRGDSVSERDGEIFNKNIEKLKNLWIQKLAIYEKEEVDLRATLKVDSENGGQLQKERETLENLDKWREFLFGGPALAPQADFNGDLGKFVHVRCQWDHCISDDGTPLPPGWVVPNTDT